ncbi:MAG: hypothetical protein DRP71_10220 [Verrucomicrobia bacterium]|nr:MAG: hypothetical protein DRP71_10220 [Verrucomicrobiota bacterium]
MPQEKPPRKSVFWWTCGRTFAHCGFLVAYLANGILSVVAASLLFLLFSSEVPVPGFLIKALEANLAAEGLGQKIESIQFDSGGRILLNGIRLYSESYDEPLVVIDQALVTIDLQSLVFGRFRAAAVRISDGTLLSPSVVSPSGVPRAVLSDLSGSIRLADGGIKIDNVRFNAGKAKAMITGSVQLPERKETTQPQPGLSTAIAELIRQIPRIIRIQNSMTALEAPIARIRVAPNRNQGYDARVHLLAEEYHGPDGIAVQGLDATVAVTTHRGKVSSIEASGMIASGERSGMVNASSVFFQAHWDRLPDSQNPYPDRVEIGIGQLSGYKATLRNIALVGRSTADDALAFRASAIFGREPIAIEGSVAPGSGSAVVAIEGRAGSDWLDRASEIIGTNVTYYADLSTRPIYRAGVVIGPDWSWSKAEFETMASGFVARGVLLDTAYARGQVTPAGVSVDQIEIRQGRTRASMSYQDTFATRDYRFLIRGTMRPLGISRWFGPWWERFWNDFEVPEKGGACDLSIHGNWFGIQKTLVTGQFDAENVAVKSTTFDHVRGKLFIRPHYFDIYDATATQSEGLIGGDFQLLFKPGEKLPVEQHFSADSTIDLKSAAAIFGDGGVEMLAPYDYDIPPKVAFIGTVLRAGDIWDTDISIEIDTDRPFRYEEFPLESLQTKVRILNKRVELPTIVATYADGTLSGEALVDDGILTFDASLKGAVFQNALMIFGNYTRRNEPEPKEENTEERFEDRNPGGKLNISLKAKGELGDFTSYNGVGRFDISEAELGKIHLFGVLSAALQSTMFRFSTLRFTEASSTFQINRNEAFFPDLAITGPLAAIKSEGSYDIPTGDLNFQARFYPFDRGGLPVFTLLDTFLNPFSTFFEIKMTGSLATPKMRVSLGGAENTRPFATEEAVPTDPPPTSDAGSQDENQADSN